MGDPRRSQRCASISAKAKLRSSTRALSAPPTHILRLGAAARSSSRPSRPKQVVISTQTRRSRSHRRAGRSKTPAKPRPLPDHTLLDLPRRTPEERRRYWNGFQEYMCDLDPVNRRIREMVSRGCTTAEIEASVSIPLSRPESPVLLDNGDDAPHFDDFDHVVDNQNWEAPANDSRPDSLAMLDIGDPVPEWQNFDDFGENQEQDVPADDSQPHSPFGCGTPGLELHIDDLEEDNQDWSVAENLSPLTSPPPYSPAPEEAHEMEVQIDDGLFSCPPSPTQRPIPIYGYGGRIDYPTGATFPERTPELPTQKTETADYQRRKHPRKQVMVPQDMFGQDIVKNKPLDPNLSSKPINVKEPSPDDSDFSYTPSSSEICEIPHAIKTEPTAPSSSSSSSPVTRLSTSTFIILKKAERQAAVRQAVRQAEDHSSHPPNEVMSMIDNPRICVTGRPDFSRPKLIEESSGPITPSWIKAASPDTEPAPPKKTEKGGSKPGKKIKEEVPMEEQRPPAKKSKAGGTRPRGKKTKREAPVEVQTVPVRKAGKGGSRPPGKKTKGEASKNIRVQIEKVSTGASSSSSRAAKGTRTGKTQKTSIYNESKHLMEKCTTSSSGPSTSQQPQQSGSRKRVAPRATEKPERRSARLNKKQ